MNSSADRQRPSAGLMVALSAQGVILPAADPWPERLLGLGELEILEKLARGEHTTAAIVAAAGGNGAASFVDELRARHLLVPAKGGAGVGVFAGAALAAGDWRASDHLVLPTPLILRLSARGFEALGHDGNLRVSLRAVEVLAAAELRNPRPPSEAWRDHRDATAGRGLDESAFTALLRRLVGAGLVECVDPKDPGQQRGAARADSEIRKAVTMEWRLFGETRERMAARDAAEERRLARGAARRTQVVPVHFQSQTPPLALGMIFAYARDYEGGRLREIYDFRPDWTGEERKICAASSPPAIYLFSHYVWSSARSLEFSAKVKAANPGCVTVHGGPNVPKYEGDVVEFFRAHPHVDVAVRGEGEVTTAELLSALAPSLGQGRADLSVLAAVPGLSVRYRGEVVRSAERARLSDLNVVPSPILTGLFDSFIGTSLQSLVIESNRGCPYGCTFCDWGSATAQRIRQFSLDRTFAELEWGARNGAQVMGMADANFGIFERDVAIAEKVAELKARYGFPHHFGLNYAKNSLKHLKPIVKILLDAGILTYGQISLQSMDKDTLETIDRANIKLEKYEDLAQEFRRGGLPLFIDLMMGLPGATTESFRTDLQESIDREVIAKVFPTQLLVNSPMNEPSYRRKHGIEVRPGELVSSSATFSRDEYDEMGKLRRVFLLLWKFGVLRHVASYVRQETGTREIDFFARLWRDTRADPERWPLTVFTLEAIPGLMVPPGRWRLLLDEVEIYLTEVLGIAADDALTTVLEVQNALLPARDRRFPETVTLAHDYAAWHAAMIAAKDAGHHRDWPEVVPTLRTYGPAVLSVDDRYEVCSLGMGKTVDADVWGVWELDSPVSRPVRPLHAALG